MSNSALVVGLNGVLRRTRDLVAAAAGQDGLAATAAAWLDSSADAAPVLLETVPQKRRESWRSQGVTPGGAAREQAALASDQSDPKAVVRAALAAAWIGQGLSTGLQDALFGAPRLLRAEAGPGALSAERANLLVSLDDLPLAAALAAECKQAGVGLACAGGAAEEFLLQQGAVLAGDACDSARILAAGLCDAALLDAENAVGPMPAGHAALLSINGVLPGARALDDTLSPAESARQVIAAAVQGRSRRPAGASSAGSSARLVAGYTPATIVYTLGGAFRGSLEPLILNIVDGHVRGVAVLLGAADGSGAHTVLIRELIKQDVLVLLCNGASAACALDGLLVPEAAALAGAKLAQVCEAVGIGPVLYMGAPVRALQALAAVVQQGNLGDIAALPIACALPSWRRPESPLTGLALAASGALCVAGGSAAQFAQPQYVDLLHKLGGEWKCASDPRAMAALMIERIDAKRAELGIDRATERVLVDMADRRALG